MKLNARILHEAARNRFLVKFERIRFMTTPERIARVVQTVAQKPMPADPEESLFESGVLDSFALPDMIGGLEKEFGITVPDSDLTPRKFDSLARIADYISVRVS
jgi:acyl carrier protein